MRKNRQLEAKLKLLRKSRLRGWPKPMRTEDKKKKADKEKCRGDRHDWFDKLFDKL